METFRFLNFKVYQDAKLFNRKVFLLTKRWGRLEVDLVSQLLRASLSICLNIAEGSAKNTDKDFRRYIQNSLGSVNEVVACLDVASSMGLITSSKYKGLVNEARNIAKQLGGFSRKLLNR